MRMLVQFVVSLALLCATPHFLSAQLVPRSANTLAYFSHIADGGGWQTTFTVSNPNRNLVFGEISFRDSEGQNLYLDLEGHDPSGSVEFWIPAFGTVEFTSSATGPDVRVGWATLRASNSIQGVATYSALENGSPRYSISVPASLPTIRYFSAATPDLGLAVGNIYSSEVSIGIGATSNDGSSFHGNMTLPAHGHRAKILSEVIPDLPRGFVGTVSIIAENAEYFSALTLRGAGGVYSSLPSGESARPAPHFFVIWNVFSQLRATVASEELIPDPHSIELEINEEPVINAFGHSGGIQINLALAELLADSESELAFIIGHELGHVYQFRTGEQRFNPDNRELDADVWGLWLSLLSGYDPYAGAGALAKLEMVKGRADLRSQQYLQKISVHGSFNERLDFIYENIVDLCKEWGGFCTFYREVFHPHFPEGPLLLTAPQE